jgi:ribosomal protein S18 acetylase RimI-like enzyme
MKHVLDNPVWNALISGNKNLSIGNETARYFPREISPFVGIAESNPVNFDVLRQVIPFKEPAAIFSTEKQLDAAPWTIIQRIDGFQLVYPKQLELIAEQFGMMALNDAHIPQMLALTKLTNPGPFSSRTISFGNYRGIFVDDKLVAMAGQRLHAGANIEISAVCTHPNYTGKGYARQLIRSLIADIQKQNKTAYLHARADNTRAINVYRSMGFEIRSEMIIYILSKN